MGPEQPHGHGWHPRAGNPGYRAHDHGLVTRGQASTESTGAGNPHAGEHTSPGWIPGIGRSPKAWITWGRSRVRRKPGGA